jgi:hypothetical protein
MGDWGRIPERNREIPEKRGAGGLLIGLLSLDMSSERPIQATFMEEIRASVKVRRENGARNPFRSDQTPQIRQLLTVSGPRRSYFAKLPASIWSIWFFSLVWFNQPNERNQPALYFTR